MSQSKKIAFTTQRLEAHFLTEDNRKFLIDLYSNENSIKFLQGLDVEKDIELTLACYKEHNNIGAYLVFCNETSDFIGFCGVQKQEPLNDGSLAFEDDIEFLIMIDPRHNRKGYAAEISLAFLELFFENFPDRAVPARVSKENLPCVKLLEKLGFIHEGETCYHDRDNKFYLLRKSRN